MTAPCAHGMLAVIVVLDAAPAILAPSAFGQAAAGGAVEWRGLHGDRVIEAAPTAAAPPYDGTPSTYPVRR